MDLPNYICRIYQIKISVYLYTPLNLLIIAYLYACFACPSGERVSWEIPFCVTVDVVTLPSLPVIPTLYLRATTKTLLYNYGPITDRTEAPTFWA